MRSSWSRKSELNVLAGDGKPTGPKEQPGNSSTKTYSSFSSFFSRSKKPKTPVETVSIIEENSSGSSSASRPVSRLSLAGRHYRTMSRSMNDLSALISREDFADNRSIMSKSPETSFSRPESVLISKSSSTSPSKKSKTSNKQDLEPFPSSSISKRGWLNKRASRKDNSLKLQRVYVCVLYAESRLTFPAARRQALRIQAALRRAHQAFRFEYSSNNT